MHCILFLERPLLLFSQDWLAQEVFFFYLGSCIHWTGRYSNVVYFPHMSFELYKTFLLRELQFSIL